MSDNNQSIPAIYEIQDYLQSHLIEIIEARWGCWFQDHTLADLWFHLVLISQVTPSYSNLHISIDNIDDLNQTGLIRACAQEVIKHTMHELSTWYTSKDPSFRKFNEWLRHTPCAEDIALSEQERKEYLNTTTTYQFVYHNVRSISYLLQRGLSYLLEWIPKHQREIESTLIDYVVSSFVDRFDLSENEHAECEDYLERLTNDSHTIDAVVRVEESERLYSNNNNNNTNLNLNPDNSDEWMNNYFNPASNNKKTNEPKFSRSSRLKLLKDEAEKLFPKPEKLNMIGVNKDLYYQLKKADNNSYRYNMQKKPDLMSYMKPDHSSFSSGSLKNVTQEQINIEHLYPGSISKIPLGEEMDKKIKQLYPSKKQEQQKEQKAASRLFTYKPRSRTSGQTLKRKNRA